LKVLGTVVEETPWPETYEGKAERLYTCALHDTAIGIRATETSRETGSMGEIEAPADRDWGAYRQRSLVHFSIDNDRRTG
jgi:hypothetical protein